jgi:hypothetical protein
MANMHRTASGKSIDMSALAAKNENVRAIGNMNVNAKGDLIDSNNKVIAPASQRVARSYNKTTQNPSANQNVNKQEAPKTAPSAPAPVLKKEEPPVVFLEDMSEDEIEYFDEFDADVPEKKPEVKPKKK